MAGALVVAGVDIPVLEGSWKVKPTIQGIRSRGTDGSWRETALSYPTSWSFETRWMKPQDARAYEVLLTGQGHAWDFENDTTWYISSKGLTVGTGSPIGAFYPGAAGALGAASLTLAGDQPYWTFDYPIARTGFTFGFWYSPTDGAPFDHWMRTVKGSTVVSYKNGALATSGQALVLDGLVGFDATTKTLTLIGSSVGGTGDDLFDDMFCLPCVAPLAFATGFYQRGAAGVVGPFLPRVEAWGSLLEVADSGSVASRYAASVLVQGVAGDHEVRELGLVGGYFGPCVKLSITLEPALPGVET